jgi:glycosyltransferase involved in cell wall biosynthesis
MHILHTECGLNWGGQEYRTLLEVNWLNKHGHLSWIACDPRGETFKRAGTMNVKRIGVSMRNSVDLGGILALITFCRRHDIDVIHTHGPKDSWMCYFLRLLGWKVVRSRHISVPVRKTWRHEYVYRKGCDKIIATAEAIRRTLIEENHLPAEKIAMVGEGIDLALYKPENSGAAFRQEFGIPADAPLFGIIAMLRGDKGHSTYVAAALQLLKTHPQARFVIVGEAIGGGRVKREIEALLEPTKETRIILTGYRQDVPEITAALDVLVVASTGVEGQTRVIPQAFATRRTAIATTVGGITEIVRDGENGLLVPPGNVEALRAAMARLLDDPALRQRLADTGYDDAQKHLSMDAMMDKTLDVYCEIVGFRNSRGRG